MKLRKIWVLPFLLLFLFSTGCAGKESILHSYERVVSAMGKLTCTPEYALIGTRMNRDDNYTGAYAAACEQARGTDIVFGGCSLQTRKIKVTGEVSCQSGLVQLLIKNGSDELRLIPDAAGKISQEITETGGDWYLAVKYADFSGNVTLCSTYIK